MSAYTTNRDPNMYWGASDDFSGGSYYEADYSQFHNQRLDFKPFEMNNEYGAPQQSSEIYDPTTFPANMDPTQDELDEPPLLEELEIYPDRIMQKIMVVINPFKAHGVTDDAEYLTKESDLAGPVAFYLVLAVSLLLSGKNQFGYIYGITVVSGLFMYCLLNLMTVQSGVFTVSIVFSILGYSFIPVVGLAVISVFFTVQGLFGFTLAFVSVIWSSISAVRLFTAISSNKEQQFLIGYPVMLIASLYVVLIIF